MLEEIELLKRTIMDSREAYLKYIADRGIPIEDRWAVFISAPDGFRNTESDICITDDMPHYNKDDIYVERYQRMDLIDYVIDTFGSAPWNDDAKELVEYLLANNCEGYIYDW